MKDRWLRFRTWWFLLRYNTRQRIFRLQARYAPKTPSQPEDRCARCLHPRSWHHVIGTNGTGGVCNQIVECHDQCGCRVFVSEHWFAEKLEETLKLLKRSRDDLKVAKKNVGSSKGALSFPVDESQRGALSIPATGGELTLKKEVDETSIA